MSLLGYEQKYSNLLLFFYAILWKGYYLNVKFLLFLRVAIYLCIFFFFFFFHSRLRFIEEKSSSLCWNASKLTAGFAVKMRIGLSKRSYHLAVPFCPPPQTPPELTVLGDNVVHLYPENSSRIIIIFFLYLKLCQIWLPSFSFLFFNSF